MPPQGYALGALLGWNYHCSLVGKVTLSQFSRRHKLAFVVGWTALNLWLIPHIMSGANGE